MQRQHRRLRVLTAELCPSLWGAPYQPLISAPSEVSRHLMFARTHHSFADVPLLRHSIAPTPARRFTRRLVVAAAAEGLPGAGFLGRYAVAAFGLFQLEPAGDRDASLPRLLRVAQPGNAVVIFPHGRHARAQEEIEGNPLANFKAGFAHPAEALDAAVVPFGLAGTEIMMPAFLEHFEGRVVARIPVTIRRTRLAIAFGAPLRQDAGEDAHQPTARVQHASFQLTRQAEAAIT